MSHYNPDPSKTVNLTIDGIPVTVPEGTSILEAAKKVNIAIPSLCHFDGLGKRAVCRLCVVECDGRGKLVPACANDVWEGVKVVTNNLRILNIRKTIIELLLTNHPPECLNCVKNNKCELQTLAADFGILKIPFRRGAADSRPPTKEGGTLVRDMSKCVKCGRCVEVCQEVQTIRAINSSHRGFSYEVATPYGQALSDGPCIFCGQCAAVCPVGAIYENEQNLEVRSELNKSGVRIAIQISPSVAAAIGAQMRLPPGTITSGKLVTTLKRMGFDKVLDTGVYAGITAGEEYRELLGRIETRAAGARRKLPMITSCSPGFFNFVKKFYPDLTDHLPSARKSPQQNFSLRVKAWYSAGADNDPSKVKTVSVMPCIANKFETWQPGDNTDGGRNPDFALTVEELLLLIRQSGIEIRSLPETPFDCLDNGGGDDSGNKPSGAMEAVLRKVYDAYTGKVSAEESALPEYREAQDSPGIEEAETVINGTKIKVLTVNGLANARVILDAVRKGECDADFIEVISCTVCRDS